MWWFAAALAAPPELALAPEVRWIDGRTVLQAGDIRLEVDEGFAFPVRAGDGPEPVGFVLVGAGEAAFPLDRAGEALAFADTLAVAGRVDVATARRAIDDEQWREPFDVALVVGTGDDLRRDLASWPVVVDAEDDVLYLDADPQEVVVQSWRLGPARTRAARALAERVRRLADAGVDPRVMLDQARDQPATWRWLAEVHTARSWRPFLAPADATLQDRWLSLAHDPAGAVDDVDRDVVFVHGQRDGAPRWRVLAGTPHAAVRRGGVRIEQAVVNAVVRPGAGANPVAFEALLSLTTDVRTRLVPLSVPTTETPALSGLAGTRSFHLDAVELADGTPLAPTGAVFGPRRPAGRWDSDPWRLPAPLAPGERVTVRVRWTDAWDGGHVLDVQEWLTGEAERLGVCMGDPKCSCADLPDGAAVPTLADLGRVVVDRAVVPVVPGEGDGFPAEIRIGSTLGAGWRAAVDGVVAQATGEGGRWWIAHATGAARVAFGQLSLDEASAVGPFPAVQVLRHAPMRVDSRFVRSVLQFYDAALPPYPGTTVTVVQGPSVPALDPVRADVPPAARGAVRAPRRGRGAAGPARPVATPPTRCGSAASPSCRAARRARKRAAERDYPHQVERRLRAARGAVVRGPAEDAAGRLDARPAAAVVPGRRVEAWPAEVAVWDAHRDRRSGGVSRGAAVRPAGARSSAHGRGRGQCCGRAGAADRGAAAAGRARGVLAGPVHDTTRWRRRCRRWRTGRAAVV
ncbi:MAG: hypothetical protein R3F59_25065 [Myxococcota bacterium]